MQILINKLKALSDPNRFRILMMLEIRPLCVCELLEVLEIAGGTLSNHLKILKNSGLIDQNKDGRWVEYRLLDSDAAQFINRIGKNITDRSLLEKDREIIDRINRSVCSSKL
ncbi:MAG: hypothetical protein B6241_02370 [Spirochaetaceae bacterium 4572_59]|nr:MAG: hypothetical protein B6241_02370 [Spirochaetaceae bacterium 4572_59]